MHIINSLEKEMATHSSILAWRVPWTLEPSELQSMGLQRGDMNERLTHTHTHTHTHTLTIVLILFIMFYNWKLVLWTVFTHYTPFSPTPLSLATTFSSLYVWVWYFGGCFVLFRFPILMWYFSFFTWLSKMASESIPVVTNSKTFFSFRSG